MIRSKNKRPPNAFLFKSFEWRMLLGYTKAKGGRRGKPRFGRSLTLPRSSPLRTA